MVIAGGGTAGWIVAAFLSKLLKNAVDVHLIESTSIPTIGVGEATVNQIRVFNQLLGIDEASFMREVHATFKYGIEFVNWGQQGNRYIHSFGLAGKGSWACQFQHFWLAAKRLGITHDYGEYCLEHEAAKAGRFYTSEKSKINYGYHLDASLYANFLKNIAIEQGVNHIQATIDDVILAPDNGYIQNIKLDNGKTIDGDLFIDCTGLAAKLTKGALHTGFESFSHLLPCDSAVAVQTTNNDNFPPYTQSIAHNFGWQWKIPLQHRTGNGLVYCSHYVSDELARDTLLQNLSGEPISDIRAFRYETGRRTTPWHKNCVAIGLSSGFLEPLESTSIHLILTATLRLIKLFPHSELCQSNIDEYNQQTNQEIDSIRDFLVMHYHLNDRTDSPFWRHCRTMNIPDSLQHKLNLFKNTGNVVCSTQDLFQNDSWVQVMLSQGVTPESYHPILDTMPESELREFLTGFRSFIQQAVSSMPDHQAFIEQYCKQPSNNLQGHS